MVQRVTYRRKKSYNTKSNGIRTVRTPGGRFSVQYTKKHAHAPRCADTGVQLYGIPALRPFEKRRLSKTKRTVRRAYGGVLSAAAVKARVLRAFLSEEARVFLSLVKQQAAATAAAAAAAKKSKKVVKKADKKAVTKK